MSEISVQVCTSCQRCQVSTDHGTLCQQCDRIDALEAALTTLIVVTEGHFVNSHYSVLDIVQAILNGRRVLKGKGAADAPSSDAPKDTDWSGDHG